MENKEITFNMRYADIVVSKYSQFDLENSFKKDKIPLVEFQSNFNFKVLKSEEQLVCIVNVRVVILETGEEFSELMVENIFDIQPFKEIVKTKSKNNYDIPDVILQNLVSLSISTVRGILSEKLKGTIVQKEVYPLIDLVSLFKNRN